MERWKISWWKNGRGRQAGNVGSGLIDDVYPSVKINGVVFL